MAHEITKHDHVALRGVGAWHGLGTIVEEATPMEALKIAKLDWEVIQQPLYRQIVTESNSQFFRPTDSHVANVRKDTDTILGVVGKGWTPFQNHELADFCTQLHEEGNVKIESAGSIRGGEKVWFLLRGEQFAINRGKDQVYPYICVSNGFDGCTSLRCTPTTVRVVCSNTLHMVIPKFEKNHRLAGVREASYVVRHTGKLTARVEEARNALKMYSVRLQENRELMERLANVDMNAAKVKKFFLEMNQRHFGELVENPTTKAEMRRHTTAMECVAQCIKRFEKEESLAGATAWNAFNAYTGMIQHDYSSRRKDPTVKAEAKLSTNLFGLNSDRTIETFRYALQLAG